MQELLQTEPLPAAQESSAQKPVIDVRNVKKIYHIGSSKIRALDGLSMQVYEGEFCCIVGRSGSGKSTLLNLIAGIEHADKGQIIIAGKRVDLMNQAELIMFRQKNIGFVFQSFNLIPTMNAIENTALPLSFRGVARSVRNLRAAKMLKLVGVGSHAKHKPSQLSGGQQQRVGIARALVANPKIVFADEPTGNLDSKTSESIMDLITGIFTARKTTFVMVTHDPTMSRFADRVITVLDGKAISTEVRNPITGELEHVSQTSGETLNPNVNATQQIYNEV